MKKITLLLLTLISAHVFAEKIATIETSGILFKDTLEIHAFDDPTINGVTCYVSTPKKSLSFSDPSNVSISCRKVGEINGDITSSPRIFKKSKNLFFKNLYVDRFFDSKRNVLIYVAYTEKMTGNNASNSISVVALSK